MNPNKEETRNANLQLPEENNPEISNRVALTNDNSGRIRASKRKDVEISENSNRRRRIMEEKSEEETTPEIDLPLQELENAEDNGEETEDEIIEVETGKATRGRVAAFVKLSE